MNFLTVITSFTDNISIGSIITGTLLFLFFVIISIFSAIFVGSFCSNFFDNTLPKCWEAIRKAIRNFFSIDVIFGSEYDYLPKRKKINDFRQSQPITTCESHELIKFKSEKYKWQMFSGIPSGDSDLIDTVIERTKSSPFHNETHLQVLENWKSKGSVRVFTSLSHYRCKKCLAIKIYEFYTMPIKADGRPLIEIGMTNTTYASKFKQTTRISTVAATTTTNNNTKREVPVESLPYYCS